MPLASPSDARHPQAGRKSGRRAGRKWLTHFALTLNLPIRENHRPGLPSTSSAPPREPQPRFSTRENAEDAERSRWTWGPSADLDRPAEEICDSSDPPHASRARSLSQPPIRVHPRPSAVSNFQRRSRWTWGPSLGSDLRPSSGGGRRLLALLCFAREWILARRRGRRARATGPGATRPRRLPSLRSTDPLDDGAPLGEGRCPAWHGVDRSDSVPPLKIFSTTRCPGRPR
jgi:hypothetical protein